MGVAVTYDALGSTIATFRSGGRYTYGIIGVGYNHKTENSSLVLKADSVLIFLLLLVQD